MRIDGSRMTPIGGVCRNMKFHLCTVAGVLAAASWAAGQDVNTPPNLPATIPPVVEVPVVAGPSGGGEASEQPGPGFRSVRARPWGAGRRPRAATRPPPAGPRRSATATSASCPLKSYYDFDNDGFELGDRGRRVQLRRPRDDAARRADATSSRVREFASSGFYNPRTRVYFEGHFTKPIQYEFSFQNTFDTVALLDAYVNFNYDPRFQVRIGRYKTPFTYEWYRVHIWDTARPGTVALRHQLREQSPLRPDGPGASCSTTASNTPWGRSTRSGTPSSRSTTART